MRNNFCLVLLFLLSALVDSSVNADPLPNTNHTLEQRGSTFQSWDQPATLLIRVTGTNPDAAIKPRLWDTPPKQDPDIAICLSDQFTQSFCIPEGNTYQDIQTSICEDSQVCMISTLWLPAGSFSIAVVDVDLQFNDLIGTGSCQIGNICTIGRAQIEVRNLELPTLPRPAPTQYLSSIPTVSPSQTPHVTINSIPGSGLDTPAMISNKPQQQTPYPELTKELSVKPSDELSDAREIARILRESYVGWLNILDPCPCTLAEARNNPRFRDTTNEYFYIYGVRYLQKYYPGAQYDFRSSQSAVSTFGSPFNARLPVLRPGQQCTYDVNGLLITNGNGAGTPDAYSPEIDPENAEFIKSNSHYFWDVLPFIASDMTWQEYHQTWTPNNKLLCPRNEGFPIIETEENTEFNSNSSPASDTLW